MAGQFTPFVRKLQQSLGFVGVPVVLERGDEPKEGYPGIPDPVRDADFDGSGHRKAQLFTTFAPYFGFGTGMGSESFIAGHAGGQEPTAAIPYGHQRPPIPRRVLSRPPTRGSG